VSAAHRKETWRALAGRQILRQDDQMGDVGEESSTRSGKPVCFDALPSRIVKVARDRGDEPLDRADSGAAEPGGTGVVPAGAVPAVAQAQLHVVKSRVRLCEVEGVGSEGERGGIASQRGVDSTRAQTLAADESPAKNAMRAHDDVTSSHQFASVNPCSRNKRTQAATTSAS
jgi:hypothetical protein